MDKLACELLVHITAPSSVRDDRRYVAIAQSVLDFQPATTTKLIRHNSHSHSPIATQMLEDDGQQDLWPNIDGATATWIQAHDDEFARQQQGEDSNGASSLPFGRLPCLGDSGNGIAIGRLEPSTASDLPRPRTAPETGSFSFGIDVPFTGTSRRRARSEVSSFSNSFSTVPNSHDTPKHVGARCISGGTHGDKIKGDYWIGESPMTTQMGPERKKRRLDGNLGGDADVSPLAFLQQDNIIYARRSRTPERLTLLRKSTSQTDTRSVSSTLSPSQPLNLAPLTPRHGVNPHPHSQQVSTVDLITPSRDRVVFHEEKTSEPSPVLSVSRAESHTSDENIEDPLVHSLGNRIRQLANEANSPDPPGGEQRFTTHITKTFEILSERVPLAKVFRPILVERDVRVLERGYWLFWVKIGSDTAVVESRVSESQKEKVGQLREELEAPTLQQRLKKLEARRQAQRQGHRMVKADRTLWSEEEFVNFWQTTSQFISEGKAGWGTRLVKEAAEDRRWKITMFCWGEVLAHAWLALWILSDKLTGRIPMLWVSGDGTAVVKMSGGKPGVSRLGPWARKGGGGDRGIWGIAQR